MKGWIEKTLALPVATFSRTYLADRLETLRAALNQTAALAGAGALPDVELSDAGLKISPIENSVPPAADALRAALYRLIPHIKITDLLMEVERWTGFTRHFLHLKTDEPAKDPALLLTALLADATNLGLGKMAESCPGTSLARLSWLVAWHIRDDTYSKALAEIVNHQHRNPFAAHWGDGTIYSSDGQRFRAGGRGEASGQVNPKYGNEPGVTFYTHISDQYAPFHTKVINAAVRDAPSKTSVTGPADSTLSQQPLRSGTPSTSNVRSRLSEKLKSSIPRSFSMSRHSAGNIST